MWRSSLAIRSFCWAISALSSDAFARATASAAAISSAFVRSIANASLRAATSSRIAWRSASMRRSESQIGSVVIPQNAGSRKFIRSARALRPPRLLGISPVDPSEHIRHLRRRDRHRAGRRRGPDEPSALQTLGIERHAETIVPENLDQLAALAAEHVEVAAVWIAPQRFLHEQGERVHAATHVGMARRDPHPHPRRNRDHRRRPHASAATAAVRVAGSAAPAHRIRPPLANSTSIVPPPTTPAAAASSAIRTGAKLIGDCDRSCRRQPYSWLAWIPACRANVDTLAPGSSDAATNSCFSEALHRRRRWTDVMTSTRPFVM